MSTFSARSSASERSSFDSPIHARWMAAYVVALSLVMAGIILSVFPAQPSRDGVQPSRFSRTTFPASLEPAPRPSSRQRRS